MLELYLTTSALTIKKGKRHDSNVSLLSGKTIHQSVINLYTTTSLFFLFNQNSLTLSTIRLSLSVSLAAPFLPSFSL